MPRLPAAFRVAALVLAIAVPLLVACGSASDDVVIESLDSPTSAGAARPGGAGGGRDDRQVVFLDAGHGGRDPGWGASYIIENAPLEKDLTLDIAKRVAARLEADGFRVVLSRTADSDVNEPERDVNADGCVDPIDEVQARVDMANEVGAAVLVSIHFNGLPGSQLSGSGTFYNAVREFSDDNKRLAQLLQAAQLRALEGFGHKARDWGALRDDSFDGPTQTKCPTGYRYYTIIGPQAAGRPRPSKMPGAVVESMFLTYAPEAQLAARTDVRDALAEGYARAIAEFLRGERSGGAPRQAPAAGGPALLVDRGETARKEIALTFDAGAETGHAAAMLDILARKGVKASFGLTGAWCEKNAELAQRVTAEGHAVINHTQSHASWTGTSPGTKPLDAEQRRNEVQRAEAAIERATGQNGRPFFRSPYGDQDAGVLRHLGELGYRYNVLWSFDSRAWRGARAQEIIAKGVKAAAPGAIYVFHVAEQQDLLALEGLIDGLASAGYRFVTVPGLFATQ